MLDMLAEMRNHQNRLPCIARLFAVAKFFCSACLHLNNMGRKVFVSGKKLNVWECLRLRLSNFYHYECLAGVGNLKALKMRRISQFSILPTPELGFNKHFNGFLVQ